MLFARRASLTRNTSVGLSSMTRTDVPLRIGSGRDAERETASLLGLGFDPDPSPVALHDAFANGEPHTGSSVLVVGVESFEYAKDCVLIRCGYSDPVVRDGKVPIPIRLLCKQLNGRSAVVPSVFDGVPQEILKHLGEMAFPDLDCGEIPDRDGRPAFPYGRIQVFECDVYGPSGGNCREFLLRNA